MAKNTGSGERTAIRWLRDGVKSNYVKGPECECCGSNEDLELHHPHTFSLVFEEYCKKTGLTVEGKDEVLAMRDEFYKAHWNELVVDVLTLCSTHHKLLHKIYGSQPALSTASKQREWVERLKGKLSGRMSVQTTTEGGTGFSRFKTKLDGSFSDHVLRS